MRSPLTFDQFLSNEEQIEAHFEVYKKIWNDTICEAIVEDLWPDVTDEDMLIYREEGFWCHLHNAYEEELLQFFGIS